MYVFVSEEWAGKHIIKCVFFETQLVIFIAFTLKLQKFNISIVYKKALWFIAQTKVMTTKTAEEKEAILQYTPLYF